MINKKTHKQVDLFEQQLKSHDKMEKYLKGHVIMVNNEDGSTIVDKDNVIVLRGRTFALEKMFGVNNELNLGYDTSNLDSKRICLFKVGDGGCVDESQPFNLLSVAPDCTELGHELAFRLAIDGEDKPVGFFQAKELDDESGNIGYYCKAFDNIEWVFNSNTNDEVAVKLTLTIEEDDLKTIVGLDENNETEYTRSCFINEIGLCIANGDTTDTSDSMSNIELATRLTFESEPMFNQLKSITIYYYIYA
jgi:hypothetical protein